MAKLFTAEIDKQLFEQFKHGADLSQQMVVAKIFNPYGNGTWYLLNSDPQDPDYIWAIVDLFHTEIGSVSRQDLETIKVPPFSLPLERDRFFQPINAEEFYRRLKGGETFKQGGTTDCGCKHIEYKKGGKMDTTIAESNKEMVMSNVHAIKHHAQEIDGILKKGVPIEAWVSAKAERAATDLSDITHYLDALKPKKMAIGGMLEHDLREGDEVKEIYKDYGIIEDEEDNIFIYDPNVGKRVPVSSVEEAKRMIDSKKYADGGYMAKGGNIPRIEKRVDEVNALIKEGNDKGLEVVDESNTWQSPKKFQPLKYSNGVLYVSYEELDLYKHNKGQGSHWVSHKYRIGKSGMGLDEQREMLTDIARMYRKAINHFNTYGYADGGTVSKVGNVRSLLSQFNKEKPSIAIIMIADDVSDEFMRKKFDETIDWNKLSDSEKQKYNDEYKTKKDNFEKYLINEFVKLYYYDAEVKNKCKGNNTSTINAIKSVMKSLAKNYSKDKYEDGGVIKWQDAEEGDSANVKAENKTGVILKTYGRKFHLQFVDGSEKTYDASELTFIKDEEFAKGGVAEGEWVVYNPKTYEVIKTCKSHRAAKMLMDRLWKEGKYDEIGMKAKNEFADGGDMDYDAISVAKTKAKESIDWDKELREYAGSNYDKLTNEEKEIMIADMKRDLDRSSSFAHGGKTNKYEDYEMIVISKELDKDGGRIIKDRFLVSAEDIDEAKKIATELWKKQYSDETDLSIVKVISESVYKLRYMDKYEDGGTIEIGGNYTMKNEFGSFTSVKIMPIDANYNPSNKYFSVKVTVRKKEGDSEKIQEKPIRTYPIEKHDEFLKDLLNRGAKKMAMGGKLMEKHYQVVAIYPNKYEVVFHSKNKDEVKEYAQKNRKILEEKGAYKVIMNIGSYEVKMAMGGEISDNFYKTIGAKSKNDFFDTIYGNRQLYDEVERKLNVDRMNKLINYKEPLFSDTMSVLFSLYYSKDESHTQTKGGKTRKAFFEDAIETLYGKMAMGGETTFKEKVKAVKASLLKRKKVSPKVQKDYGKTYSPKEAEQSAKRIVGSQVAKWKEKISKK